MDYEYFLEPYKGTSSRHVCPSCGHKGEFVRYIDVRGNYVAVDVGKCNRDRCAYHKTPKQYFAEHPDERPQQTDRASSLPLIVSKEQERPQTFLDNSVLTTIQAHRERNALFRYLCSVFDKKAVIDAFSKYHVGTAKHWRKDGFLSCVFPQIDTEGRLCQIKVMAYNPSNGKRLHKEHGCEVWDTKMQCYIKAPNNADRLQFMGKRIAGKDANLKQTFFGGHLIHLASKIGIVESEKSALICAIEMPCFTWVATGGKQGCRWTEPQQCKSLIGKQVVLFPDQDGIAEWERKADILRKQGIDAQVSHICEGIQSHADISDLIIENRLRLKSEPKRQTIGELCAMLDELEIKSNRIKFNL